MKFINNKIVFCIAILSLSLNSFASTIIDRSDKAQQACKELSKESLDEMELEPTNWRSQSSNNPQGFSVEGQWITKNGSYIVECEVGFEQTIDEVEINIMKK